VIEVPSSVRLDPPPHPSRPHRRRTDDPLKEADWAQFRVSVAGMRESELAAFIRDYAAAHRPVDMGEEEFVVILRDHAAFLRNGRPPTLALPDPPPFRGVLDMSDDELETFIRDNGIKFYRGSNPVAEREAEIFKAITRAKPGPTSRQAEQDDKYRAFMMECIGAHRDNVGLARNMFIKRFGERFALEVKKNKKPAKRARRRQSIEKTAENHWYRLFPEVMK
jgi:hypothetical protein